MPWGPPTASRRSICSALYATARRTRRVWCCSTSRCRGWEATNLGDPTVANVPIAVRSGAADLEKMAEAMGAVATLAKPLNVDVLMDVVKKYCS